VLKYVVCFKILNIIVCVCVCVCVKTSLLCVYISFKLYKTILIYLVKLRLSSLHKCVKYISVKIKVRTYTVPKTSA